MQIDASHYENFWSALTHSCTKKVVYASKEKQLVVHYDL